MTKDTASGPLKDLVKGVIKNIRKTRHTEEDILGAWESAAGSRASRHSRPSSLRGSSLIVTVDGSSWLYELTLRKRDILKKLSDKLKDTRLKEIRLRIGELK